MFNVKEHELKRCKGSMGLDNQRKQTGDTRINPHILSQAHIGPSSACTRHERHLRQGTAARIITRTGAADLREKTGYLQKRGPWSQSLLQTRESYCLSRVPGSQNSTWMRNGLQEVLSQHQARAKHHIAISINRDGTFKMPVDRSSLRLNHTRALRHMHKVRKSWHVGYLFHLHIRFV